MGEDKKSVVGNLEGLAEIADSVQKLYNGRATVIFELQKKSSTKLSPYSEKWIKNSNNLR